MTINRIKNWNLSQFTRLFLGLLFGGIAYSEQVWLLFIPSILLVFQAITNTGCGCYTSNTCKVVPNKKIDIFIPIDQKHEHAGNQ